MNQEGRLMPTRMAFVIRKKDVDGAKTMIAEYAAKVSTVEFIQVLTELHLLETLRWDVTSQDVSVWGATDMQLCAIAIAIRAMYLGGRDMAPESAV